MAAKSDPPPFVPTPTVEKESGPSGNILAYPLLHGVPPGAPWGGGSSFVPGSCSPPFRRQRPPAAFSLLVVLFCVIVGLGDEL